MMALLMWPGMTVEGQDTTKKNDAQPDTSVTAEDPPAITDDNNPFKRSRKKNSKIKSGAVVKKKFKPEPILPVAKDTLPARKQASVPAADTSGEEKTPKKKPVPEKKEAKKAKPRRPTGPNDTYFYDTFYFIGRHDSSNAAAIFSFQRENIGYEKKILTTRFVGGLGWKNYWFELPPGEYPGDVLERRAISPHQAFNMKWPTLSERGEINYHFDRVYVNVVFDTLYPLHIIRDTVNESSDYFIANAVMQGQKYEINGIVLYHRLRYFTPHPSAEKRSEQKMTQEGPGKFLFLNGQGGETFVCWDRYPYPGEGPRDFAMKIDWTGEVRHSIIDVDYSVYKSDTSFVPRLQLSWKFTVPGLGTTFNIKTDAVSERYLNNRYYLVHGTAKSFHAKLDVTGMLIDSRRLTESSVALKKTKKEKNKELKKKKKKKDLLIKNNWGFGKVKRRKKSNLGDWKSIRQQQK